MSARTQEDHRFPTRRLDEIAFIERRVIDASQIPSGTSYVGLENIQTGGEFVRVGTVAAGELSSAKFAFDEQHVLFGKLRPYLGKIARPNFPGVCSTDILPVRPGPNLHRDFLAHFLLQPKQIELASSLATGANLPRLSSAALASFRIPLPPLSEQRRIAAILDQAEAMRLRRARSLTRLNDLVTARFVEQFGHPALNSKGLPLISLGDLGIWRSGGTPPRNRSDYFDGSIPWFSSGELNSIYVTNSAERITQEALHETSVKQVPAGALMLGMYDTAALKASIAGVNCACNQAVAFAEIDASRASAVFVYFAIAIGRDTFRRLQRGVRQKNLNLDLIRAIRIPRVSLDAQKEFASWVARIEVTRKKYELAAIKVDSLFASLQQRAFRGEL